MNLLEEKRTLMKLLVELMHERKAVASLYEAVEKRLNRIEEIENTISEGHALSQTTIIQRKKLITQNLRIKK
ncbi:hypothetical protein ACFFH2_10795 [Enterococcus devriesei]|uniref:hypothetical protein n=1 Tax=Enterococcus devriesei TaxID=319970 RepID=UPI0009001D13|nr:hypothetical protein [Enterococcus devriesei]